MLHCTIEELISLGKEITDMTFLACITLDAFISDHGYRRWIAGLWSAIKKGVIAYGTARAENAIRHHHVF